MPSAAERLGRDGLDGPVDAEVRRVLWGRWAGRERAFYRECARRVSSLSWADLTTICGPQVRVLVEPVRTAYASLRADDLPGALRVGALQVVGEGRRGPRIAGYSTMDPVELPRELVGALHFFEGRTTAEALSTIASRAKLRLSRELVRSLVDFGILVPAGAAPGRPRY
jgi:xanthine/CO dehydrogenase XdhC/CoxF family maturation factor